MAWTFNISLFKFRSPSNFMKTSEKNMHELYTFLGIQETQNVKKLCTIWKMKTDRGSLVVQITAYMNAFFILIISYTFAYFIEFTGYLTWSIDYQVFLNKIFKSKLCRRKVIRHLCGMVDWLERKNFQWIQFQYIYLTIFS